MTAPVPALRTAALCTGVAHAGGGGARDGLFARAVRGGHDRQRRRVVVAVGAENQYANVISQIGGKYVHATAVESNPNTDPHSFEASPSVARLIGDAQLVVQNGVGYDSFMNKIEDATPNPARKVIIAASLLGLPDSTPNPHLWYKPAAMRPSRRRWPPTSPRCSQRTRLTSRPASVLL